MKPEQFVQRLKSECRDSAVSGCVASFEKPPGRRPDQALLRLSQWFVALPSSDRELVVRAMREAADATLFGVLCVIDGVRTIESGTEKSRFTLSAERGGSVSVISPTDDFLHDIYRSEA
jgi:hypothetical protein